MANIFEFSHSNPIKFYHQSDVTLNTATGAILLNTFNPSYNFKSWDEDFFIRVLKAWEDEENYKAKFQQCDPIIFQFTGNDATTANYVVRILNCDGTTYATQSITQISGTYAGDKVYECKINTALIPEGTYHIQIQHIQTGADLFCISEPIEIKSYHKDSCQFKYYNSYNKDNIKFNANIQFIARYEGHISEFTPESSFYVYEDQPKNLELISGKVARTFTLTLINLPDYKLDQLNRITLMDSLYIDGIAYTRVENAKFEKRGTDYNPLKTYTLLLRERFNDDSLGVEIEETRQIAQLPTTHRFYIKQMTIYGSTFLIQRDFLGASNFVDYLNNLIITKQLGLDGFFGIADDGYLYYKKPSTETWFGLYTLASVDVLPYCLDLGIQVRAGANVLDVVINTATANNYAIIWGDGTQVNHSTLPAISGASGTKTYTAQKYYNARIYVGDHDDMITFGSSDDIIVSVKGEISPNSLGVDFTGCGVKEIGSSLVAYANGVYNIWFSGNELSTNVVNDYLKYVYEENVVSGANFDLSLQTTPAPPSDTQGMKAIISKIQNQGATIITD